MKCNYRNANGDTSGKENKHDTHYPAPNFNELEKAIKKDPTVLIKFAQRIANADPDIIFPIFILYHGGNSEEKQDIIKTENLIKCNCAYFQSVKDFGWEHSADNFIKKHGGNKVSNEGSEYMKIYRKDESRGRPTVEDFIEIFDKAYSIIHQIITFSDI